ncbi:polypeptide N-acetylgalactosaminyltransferase [Nesidiocoris tenuis]|nr:polypeptide N-acetylgalactosaminyltransferase [Nesidiocoris tenuis]
MSRRQMKRVCLLAVALFIGFSIILFRLVSLPLPETLRDDWVSVRLAADQKQYVDARGVHVVVGHYMGDGADMNQPNLTDEIINSNKFNPLPGEGKDGMPVVIPPHLAGKMHQLYRINRFNLMASDRIHLNRSLPDVRKKKCIGKYSSLEGLPKTSIIIVFHNEAWSTLLRTVWSVISRSPKHLLEEIILVDDASTRKFLGKDLDDYVETQLPVPTRVIRSKERIGLIKARLVGAREAKGHILTFLDAHCECTTGWLEALVSRVAENRTRIVCPVIDIISDQTFAYVRSFELHWGAFNWDLHFRWYSMSGEELEKRKVDRTEPFKTPAMAGGLFAVDKNYFFEIGAYDDKMEVWGGENLELSFRVWQCGGSVEIAPCSHVGHLFRKSSPYSFPGGVTQILYGNLARVALVWMDEWKDFFFRYSPEADRLRDMQQIRSRLEIRKRLNCKSFKWYLDNVWPQHFFPTEDRFFGRVRSLVKDKCLEKPTGKGSLNQPMGVAVLSTCSRIEPPPLRQMFVIPMVKTSNAAKGSVEGPLMTDEAVCLDAPDKDDSSLTPRVKIMACSGMKRQLWRHDPQTKWIQHIPTGLCLDLPRDGSDENGLTLNKCGDIATQSWSLEAVPWR